MLRAVARDVALVDRLEAELDRLLAPPTPKLPERPTEMRVTNAVPIRCGRLGRGAIVGRLTAAPASGVTRRRPGCVFEATVEAAGCRAGSVLGAAPRRPQREVDDRFVQRHVPVSGRHRSRRTWRLSSHCLPPRPCEGSTLSTSSFAKARSWTRVHSSASIDLRVSSMPTDDRGARSSA